MQKIALFVPSLRGGGAERVIVELARGFSNKGLSVDLVLAQREGPYLTQVPQTVRIVDLAARRVLTSLPGLIRYLRREKPQALLSTLSHANVISLLAKLLSGVPLTIVVREANTFSRSSQHSSKLRGYFISNLIRFFYRQANSVVAVSEGVANDLVQATGLSREKIRVIYNPVVTPELLQKANEPTGHPWFDDGTLPIVLGVGRLVKQKDFSSLIRAFDLVRSKMPARLVILGEGEERPALEGLVQELSLGDIVALPGFVENPFAYMAKSSVFVLSSSWEGLPNTLIQAIAVGTPVVSTDCPSGPEEILQGGRFGTLVPVADVKAIAHAVLDILKKDGSVETSEEGWRDFSAGTITDAYLSLLEGNLA